MPQMHTDLYNCYICPISCYIVKYIYLCLYWKIPPHQVINAMDPELDVNVGDVSRPHDVVEA